MKSSGLPVELEKFIFEKIDSVEQIEVLLLLREQSDRYWSAPEVSRELRSAPESVLKRLQSLFHHKLVTAKFESDPIFKYGPATEASERLVQMLIEAYRSRKFSVIHLVFSKPEATLKNFADAFRLKKDEKNHDG